ncbi:hypothetical protein CI102_9842 [Trichoderma harzianum]|nr:hypothetical protein CI102_9842 [Trichoderma harzianum]
MIAHSQSDPRHLETHSKPLPCHIVALLAPQSNIGKRHTNLLVSATQVYLNFNLAEKECNHSFSHATHFRSFLTKLIDFSRLQKRAYIIWTNVILPIRILFPKQASKQIAY